MSRDNGKLGGKQRRFLRKLAANMDTIVQVGKGGISENLLEQVDTALEARELIKIRVLPSAGDEVKGLARKITKPVGAEIVQVIGGVFILYRPSEEKPKIQLP